MPKFIFQPLVENSFRHGIKYLPPQKRGKLSVFGKTTESDIIFEIKDNGIGISPEKLSELEEKLKNDTVSKNHIGLVNVNSRIRLFYGDNYGLKIHSDTNGTAIRITIPKKNL